jgi:hypothetical protein
MDGHYGNICIVRTALYRAWSEFHWLASFKFLPSGDVIPIADIAVHRGDMMVKLNRKTLNTGLLRKLDPAKIPAIQYNYIPPTQYEHLISRRWFDVGIVQLTQEVVSKGRHMSERMKNYIHIIISL